MKKLMLAMNVTAYFIMLWATYTLSFDVNDSGNAPVNTAVLEDIDTSTVFVEFRK